MLAYVNAEFHEIKNVRSKAGKEFKLLVLRDPEEYEKLAIPVFDDLSLQGVVPGEKLQVKCKLSEFNGRLSLKVVGLDG